MKKYNPYNKNSRAAQLFERGVEDGEYITREIQFMDFTAGELHIYREGIAAKVHRAVDKEIEARVFCTRTIIETVNQELEELKTLEAEDV